MQPKLDTAQAKNNLMDAIKQGYVSWQLEHFSTLRWQFNGNWDHQTLQSEEIDACETKLNTTRAKITSMAIKTNLIFYEHC